MTRNKGPKTESYQLFDFLHDASMKAAISIIIQFDFETLQTRRAEQQLLKDEEQQREHGKREEPHIIEGQDTAEAP